MMGNAGPARPPCTQNLMNQSSDLQAVCAADRGPVYSNRVLSTFSFDVSGHS